MENNGRRLARISLITIFTVLLIDQCLKVWIKTHMYLGQEFHIAGNWFIIHFTENNGMAFGMQWEGAAGKLLLSTFRIAAAIGIGYYLRYIILRKAHTGYVFSMALIFAGAVGNIIDSAVYGLLFSDSEYQLATFLPAEGGYAGFLHGKVVDMLYFPVIQGIIPDWFPFWKGEEFVFFRPVFNIADSSITTGVFIILFFQTIFFKSKPLPEQPAENIPPAGEIKGEQSVADAN